LVAGLIPHSSVSEILRSEKIDSFGLREIIHPPGLHIGWHFHDAAALVLTLNGSSIEAFSEAQFERNEGSVQIRPARLRHYNSISRMGARLFQIEFGGDWIQTIPHLSSVLERPSVQQKGMLGPLVHRVYKEWLLNDNTSRLFIHALALEMAAHLIREKSGRRARSPVWLRSVKQRLDDDFIETPSLAELATIGGVHPTHLARQFRHHYGKSIGEYLRQRRVDAALEMLIQTDQALTDIALATGFAHHAHFSIVFKRITGLTPREFRRLHRLPVEQSYVGVSSKTVY
jgi:AraC family transcriptional regulator